MGRVCTKCGKEFPATTKYFYRNKSGKYGLRPDCKSCAKKYGQSPKGKEADRKGKLRYLYGIGAVGSWDAFFEKQNGICPGCGKHQSELSRRLDLDHDHETGEYRGLLCNICNLKAGSSKKDLQILKNLVKYLESFYKGR